jgi:hypothetical protein
VKENPTTVAKYGHRLEKRNDSVVRMLAVDRAKGNGKQNLVSLRFLKKIGAVGGIRASAKVRAAPTQADRASRRFGALVIA